MRYTVILVQQDGETFPEYDVVADSRLAAVRSAARRLYMRRFKSAIVLEMSGKYCDLHRYDFYGNDWIVI